VEDEDHISISNDCISAHVCCSRTITADNSRSERDHCLGEYSLPHLSSAWISLVWKDHACKYMKEEDAIKEGDRASKNHT